jgi:raffinose/stachyose/melibiose transport system permease protein
MKLVSSKQPYNKNQMIMGYVLIFPAMLLFSVFFVYCLVQAGRYSLMNWSGVGAQVYIGLNNYAELLRDRVFWTAFYNNWYYAAGIIIFGIIPGMLLAYFLSLPFIRGRLFFRSIYFFPRIISAVIYGAVWKWIYDPRKGFLTKIVNLLGGDGSSLAMLGSVKTAMLGITITGGWTYFGFCMVIFLAAFMSVDTSLQESAVLDGATHSQIFFKIIIPEIRPVLNTMLIYTVIDSFKVYDLVLVMTEGGPNDATQIMTYYIYKQAFQLNRYGYGAAGAILLGICMILFTIFYNRGFGKENR